jgi:hypothetical protein
MHLVARNETIIMRKNMGTTDHNLPAMKTLLTLLLTGSIFSSIIYISSQLVVKRFIVVNALPPIEYA